MKIINDERAYITSILLLVLLIPIMILLTITIDQYSHDINKTAENLESDKIKSFSEDFEDEIIRVTKESLHNITYETVTIKHSTTGKDKIKKHIQNGIDENKIRLNTDYIIQCAIKDINPSDDPFKVELKYYYEISTRDNQIKCTQNRDILVEITDKDYPVYDPLPTLKTGATLKEGYVEYENKLSEYILLEQSDVYVNVKQPIIVKECPLNDYAQHGNSNETATFCLNNHYYHNSHDAMCIFCRLENRTTCNHQGFETFILPTMAVEQAPTSIDHVLLNDRKSQYPGNLITINNNTKIYLDNGHKTKYGL